MHELSIAMSLVDVITEQLIRNQVSSVNSVTVEIGTQSGVVPSALRTAFLAATRYTELETTILKINEVDGRTLDVVQIEVNDAATHSGSQNSNPQR